jgi:hypothetical protein
MSIRNYARYLKQTVLAVGVTVGVVGAASAAEMPAKATAPAPFFLVNDNSVSFTYFPGSTDPGVFGATYNPRYQFDLTHFDVNRWGTNFIDFSYQQYGKKDPIQTMYGASGIQEADLLVRNTLSGNAFLGKDFFKNYVTEDISLAYGGFWNVVDNFLSPATRQYDIGVQFTLNLPGTVNVAVYAQKETGHITQDALCPPIPPGFYNPPGGIPGPVPAGVCAFTGDQSYKWVPELEVAITEPLTFLPTWLPLTWNSFTSVTFPKGTGLSQQNLFALEVANGWCVTGGNNPNNPCSAFTKTEVYSENRLTFDIGQLYWNKPVLWEAFVGYRYWYNKYGTDHNAGLFSAVTPNTSIESTAFVGTTYYFTN